MDDRIQTKPKRCTAVCPSCGKLAYVGHNPKIRDIVICNRCYADLEILDLNPVVLDWASDEPDFENDDVFFSYRLT